MDEMKTEVKPIGYVQYMYKGNKGLFDVDPGIPLSTFSAVEKVYGGG